MPLKGLPSARPKDNPQEILNAFRSFPKIKVAVVHPVQANVLEAVAEAMTENFIDPVLIGPELRIRAAAQEADLALDGIVIHDVAHSHAAAQLAVDMATAGTVDAIMKGSLHSDELLGAVVGKTSGLRTERRMSHAFIMDTPTYHKPLIITDAALNIAPTLEEKADICRNAIDLWKILYGDAKKPKVAILSAVETVTGRIPSTLDAAALCKMADRGQITGAELDGPLAFDNAISTEAARDKGIISSVAGDADILVVPNIETGNALAKQMIFLGGAEAAGIILGTRAPIILTSRADSTRARLFSCGVAMALSAARKDGRLK